MKQQILFINTFSSFSTHQKHQKQNNRIFPHCKNQPTTTTKKENQTIGDITYIILKIAHVGLEIYSNL